VYSGSVVTRLRVGQQKNRGMSPNRGKRSLFATVQTGSGVHPASYPKGTEGFLLRGKATDYEADRSPPSSVKFQNAWSYTFSPHGKPFN
jgi:hypothetical protein